jgi:hypothetical protein
MCPHCAPAAAIPPPHDELPRRSTRHVHHFVLLDLRGEARRLCLPWPEGRSAPLLPKKRKVGSSTLPLTTRPERDVHGSEQGKHELMHWVAGIVTARSRPLVTAGCRTLGHVECTERYQHG